MKLADITDLQESSGYSLQGSFTPDLVFSKLWLINQLAKIVDRVDVMYVLGSWYGNLSLLLRRFPLVTVDKIINIDTNQQFLRTGQQILNQLKYGNIEHMAKNANDIDYRQLTDRSAVVNTSLTDMSGTEWFENIPPGTLVVLQARDQDPGNQFDSVQDIQAKFPLDQVLYQGTMTLRDPQTQYHRFMIIGIR
jgi:hypothetical protein